MSLRRVGAAVLLTATLVAPVAAQQQSEPSAVDVSRLPLDLERIQRQLKATSERQEHDGLRLQYFVDVYGKSPKIEFFAPGENLRYGPTPGGAPTHKDMLDIMTPKEFRAPVMDFNGVMQWLSDKLKK
jgi:hypothetical protein